MLSNLQRSELVILGYEWLGMGMGGGEGYEGGMICIKTHSFSPR